MSKLIVKAITEHYGERCPDYDEDCFCCKVWSEYDALTSPARCDELETVAHEVYGHNKQPKLREEGLTSYEKDWGFSAVELVTRQNAEEVIAAKDARIAELEADNKRLREALEPFADVLSRYTFTEHQIILLSEDNPTGRRLNHLMPEVFERAREALGEVKP